MSTSPRAPRGLLAWLAIAALGIFATGLADAKSLYLIANINARPTPISTYDLQPAPAHVVFQATQSITSRAGGAVGLAIDTDNKKLFTTYEVSNTIQLVDATNFADLGTTTAPGASNLAGVVIDQGKKKLYAVDRNTNHLYVYSWDSATNSLTLDGGAFIALPGVSSAHGLALDETRGRLYVGDSESQTVRYFNTSNWSIAGTFSVSPTTTQTPMAIAVDSRRNTVFMGNAYGPFGSRGQLVKHALDTGTTSVYTLPGASTGGSSGDNIVGVAVDEDTGHVYATTGNQGSGGSDTLIVFDQNLNVLKNDLGAIGNPTGIAIPRTGISFNPLNFSKSASVTTIASGANLTYRLCYDNLVNTTSALNVSITDTLPTGATYVSATGPATLAGNAVTWTIGPVAGMATQACHDLVVNVTAPAGGELFNSATIVGTLGESVVPTTQTLTTDVIGGFRPLVLTMSDDADPVSTGTNLTYQTCVSPGPNTQTVNEVIVSNPIPTGTSFVAASGSGSFNGTTVRWDLGNLAPGSAAACVDLTLLVTGATGSQVTNTATVTSNNTSPANVSATTDIASSYKPLAISYDDGVSQVAAGSTLTFQVCFDNLANALPVSGVRIRGQMPDGTRYVSNTGPGTYDGTFITWNVGAVAAGAAQQCYALVVDVVGDEGDAVSGAMVLSSTEVQPSSSASHSTAIVAAVASVVIEGRGEGGGSIGALELLFGLGAASLACLRRRHAAAARRVLVAVTLAGAGFAAQAAGPGWYVGGGIGEMRAHATAGQLQSDLAGLGHATQVTMDNRDTAWKVFGGYRLNPNLAIEAGYVDLGQVSSVIGASGANVPVLVDDVAKVHPWTVTGVSLSGIFGVPVGKVHVFGKLGLIRWDAEAHALLRPTGTPSALVTDKGTSVTYGLGASLDIPNTRFTVRGEWERFRTPRNDPSLLSISLSLRF